MIQSNIQEEIYDKKNFPKESLPSPSKDELKKTWGSIKRTWKI